MKMFASLALCVAGVVPSGFGDSPCRWCANTDGNKVDIVTGETSDGSEADVPRREHVDWNPGPGDVSFVVPERDEPMDPSLAACMSDAERRICIPDFDFGEGPEVEDLGEEPSEVDIVEVILARMEREMASFTIAPAPVIVQPAGGEVLVGMYTIFYTDPAVQRFSTTLLDHGVVLEVEPVLYEWDFGDGSEVFVTSDPGRAYPQHTITHTYTTSGTVAPELTTRWVGRVWIEGIGGWFAVRGQGVTLDQGDPVEAVSKQNRLVPGV
ncbi:PKD domain-containing protein [Pseudactinotalea sp. HY158]|nr:PKD domain-containing protein [Pseudactinotalea sp. HY158]